ncbi:hypothetical protein WA026_011441 [Henosepilachna vigintioctopunctata]|uniref:RNase H type-1 domain-containing protein n=1 Tax=Henosepilachna vigintioctopunctata TaxID=420089 RepID=A0AAW1TTN3_9CUCU
MEWISDVDNHYFSDDETIFPHITVFGIPTQCSIFTGEVTLTDSLSGLITLQQLYSENIVVQQLREELYKLQTQQYSVNFIWIPSHVGISGNEKADELAN